jgi:DNA repair protein RecO (recombination protein O)
MKYNYHAITLDKKEIGETDRLYTFYTYEKGIVRVSARAVRKTKAKLAAQVEDFVFSHITIAQNYGRGILAGAVAEDYFENLHKNYFALVCVDEVRNVLLTTLGENDCDRNIFVLFVQYLKQLDILAKKKVDNRKKMQWITDSFLIKFFALQGYIFNVKSCCVCKCKLQEERNVFSPQKGGIICFKCVDKREYINYADPDTLKALRIIQDNKLQALTKVVIHADVQKQLKKIVIDIERWIMR